MESNGGIWAQWCKLKRNAPPHGKGALARSRVAKEERAPGSGRFGGFFFLFVMSTEHPKKITGMVLFARN
jgi:hypothetical protein